MNRLIIIGNGFDLSLGLKTSFYDFITDYFYNAINQFIKTTHYSDDLLDIEFKFEQAFYKQREEPISHKKIYEFIAHLIKNPEINFTVKSALLKRLHEKINRLNWVDIELEFFGLLAYYNNAGGDNSSHIAKLNNDLDVIKNKLITYLKIQQDEFSNTYEVSPLTDCFKQIIKSEETVFKKIDKPKFPDSLYFLNFNYTNTLNSFIKDCESNIKASCNYIHGTLDGKHGFPVFGFGDEFDKRYTKFEDKHNNMLFRHIKSFEYLKTKNYFNLITFIESNDFQVHIYGHSCGISDRTMLNQIFEHEHCISVKIFYYQKDESSNDFTEKTYEISRHFKNKGDFRKKLIPYDMSEHMPQLINQNN